MKDLLKSLVDATSKADAEVRIEEINKRINEIRKICLN